MLERSFFVGLLFVFVSFSWAQEFGGAVTKGGEPVANRLDPLEPIGALEVGSNTAMLQGACEYRKKVAGFVKVYKICGHSGSAELKSWKQAFEDAENPYKFALSLDFTYDVGGERAAKSFEEVLENNKITKERREAFLAFVARQNIKKTSRLELHFNTHAEAPFVASFRDESGEQRFTSQDKELGKGVAEIWLGEKPVSQDIKKALLR